MDKRRILRALKESGTCALLTGDEIRLYLLLLAASRENGQGVIPRSVIRETLGTNHPPIRLTLACMRLEQLGLIEFDHRHTRSGNELRYQVHEPLNTGIK